MPVPMDFTEAYAEAVMAADGDVTYYDCLVIRSTSEEESIMLVHSFTDLVTNQGTYHACQFDAQPPTTEGEIVGQMTITFDFLPKAARVWIAEQSTNRSTISMRWLQYLSAEVDPDFECRVPLYVTNVERVSGGGVTVTATLPDLVNTPFCRRRMTRAELPGLAV